MSIDIGKLLSLPVAERLRLAEMLRDGVGDSPDRESLPLTPAQQAELERRLDEYPQDEDHGRPVEEVIAEIRRRIWAGD